MEMRQIDEQWWLASELVIVAMAVIFSVALLTNQETLFSSSLSRSRAQVTLSRETPNYPDLEVVGVGTEPQKGVGDALQGASSIPQADSQGGGLQSSASNDSGLQPNSGNSSLPDQQKLQ